MGATTPEAAKLSSRSSGKFSDQRRRQSNTRAASWAPATISSGRQRRKIRAPEVERPYEPSTSSPRTAGSSRAAFRPSRHSQTETTTTTTSTLICRRRPLERFSSSQLRGFPASSSSSSSSRETETELTQINPSNSNSSRSALGSKPLAASNRRESQPDGRASGRSCPPWRASFSRTSSRRAAFRKQM